MKKYLIVLLTILLMIPAFVLADGGGPTFAPYDAYVNDKSGAYLYKENDDNDDYTKTKYLLEYNANVRIQDEVEVSKGVYYGALYFKGEDGTEEYLYINLNKVSLMKDTYTLADLKKELDEEYEEEKDEHIIVIGNDEKIYNGPSVKYTEKKSITDNTSFDVIVYLSDWIYAKNDNDEGWIKNTSNVLTQEVRTLWLLEDFETYDKPVSLGGVKQETVIPKGEKFIDAYQYSDYKNDIYMYRLDYNENVYYIQEKNDSKIAESYDQKSILIKNDKILDDLNGKEVASVPIGSEVKTTYIYSKYSFIEYDGKSGWIENKSLGYKSNFSVMNIDEVKLYNSVNGNVSATLPAYTELTGTYEYELEKENDTDTWYYISYKNKNYWLLDDDSTLTSRDDDDYEDEVESDHEVYDKIDGEKTGAKVLSGNKVVVKYYYYNEDKNEYWYYVESKKVKGWILDNEEEMIDVKESIEQKQEQNETFVPENINDEPMVVKNESKLSTKETIIIGVLSAIILALFVVVIIMLINRKKKDKKVEEKLEENKVEENKDDKN